MELYYIPFDIKEVLSIINDAKQFTIDDILKFHIIVVASNSEDYKSNPNILKNIEDISKLPKIIGKFAAEINDSNLIQFFKNTDDELEDAFWDLINQYKIYNRISVPVINEILKEDISPYTIFSYKDIVYHYDEQCLQYIRSYNCLIEMLISKHFEEQGNNRAVFFPKSLDAKEKAKLAEQYVKSSEANPNYLTLIVNAKSTKDFPISNELRLLAKQKHHEWCKNHIDKGLSHSYGACVSFVSIPDFTEHISRENGTDVVCEFSKEWIADNLDYATLLNNFIYLFGYCDHKFRSEFISNDNDRSSIEAIFGTHNKTDYKTGVVYNAKHLLFSAEMAVYNHELAIYGIDIENVFKWFFETYLKSEFNATGFYYLQNSKETTYLEKCIILSCTIDSVLKQFNMFCLNNCIDRELIEISSKPLLFSEIPSFFEKKYVYVNSRNIEKECGLLYANQSYMTYTEKTKRDYDDLVTMLANENVTSKDLKTLQQTSMEWLVNRGSVTVDEKGVFHAYPQRTRVLKEIYKKEYLCYQHIYKNKEIIDKLIDQNELKCESSLFSKPEQDYLDFMLNNSHFGNGPALRNKYVHGAYSLDEEQNQKYYYELLKIMTMIIIKINDEFCLKYPMINNTAD